MFRILLSPLFIIIFMMIIPSAEKALFFLPLLFALSVSLVNTDKIKINRLSGIMLSILQSYLVFLGLGIVIYFFDEWVYDTMKKHYTESEGVILITVGGYLAAMLLFYFYSFLFKIINLKFSFRIISLCYAFVIIVMLIFSKNEYLQFGVDKFPSYLISWCILMSSAYSLSLNREVFLKILESNKKKYSTKH